MYGEGRTRGLSTELRIRACTNQALAAVELDPLAATYRPYLRAYLRLAYERTRESASGGVQPNLNLSHIRNIVLPVAPLVEAERLTAIATGVMDLHDQLAISTREAQAELGTLDQSILARAFRGELVDQDPNDEPAEALLARIRGERDAPGRAGKGRRGTP